MGVMTSRRRIVAVGGEQRSERPDDLAVEAPLTIVVGPTAVATTMRTPGHDLELVAGWLVAEAGVRTRHDLVTMGAFSGVADRGDEVDTVRVALAGHLPGPAPRSLVTSTSCGVCSAQLLAEVPAPGAPLAPPGWTVPATVLLEVPALMRARQRAFDRTGAVHAAAVLDTAGSVLVVREDVGRHNAVDKVVGERLLAGDLPLAGRLLAVSGRVSFEIVQKALAAGAAGLVAVSAPSTLAVDLAREHGLLLAALVRDGRMNLYSRADLVTPTVDATDGEVG